MTGKTIKSLTVEEIENAEEKEHIASESVRKVNVVKEETVAAKKYDCKMKEEVVSIFEPQPVPFMLPTKTKVYHGPGISKDGNIYIRRFTTKEENSIQTSLSKNQKDNDLSINGFLKILNTAIDNCIKSDVSIYEIPIIDKVPLLIKLISLSYGNKLKIAIPCDGCGKEHVVEINLDKDFVVNYVTDEFEVPKTIALTGFSFPVSVDVSIPTIEFEDAFGGEKAELLRQFEALIVDAHGQKPDGSEITIEDIPLIVENIEKEDKDKIKDYISSFEDIGTNLQLKPMVLCKEKTCSLKNKKVQPFIELKFLLNQLLV
jgi:hypothetical protein